MLRQLLFALPELFDGRTEPSFERSDANGNGLRLGRETQDLHTASETVAERFRCERTPINPPTMRIDDRTVTPVAGSSMTAAVAGKTITADKTQTASVSRGRSSSRW
jgi:hypothetical protein